MTFVGAHHAVSAMQVIQVCNSQCILRITRLRSSMDTCTFPITAFAVLVLWNKQIETIYEHTILAMLSITVPVTGCEGMQYL